MRKQENYFTALENLSEIFNHQSPYETVILIGSVGLYKICFEQAWKAMKEILEYNGVSESRTGSPRQVLKAAYQAEMIRDEELWLEALVSRNNVAHAYNRSVAEDIVKQTKEKYYQMFCELKTEIEEHWN